MGNEKASRTEEPTWAAFVAIDWADQKHYWRLAPSETGRQEVGEVKNTPEAVDEWACQLRERFEGRPIAVCLEQSRGSLVILLAKYPHLVLFPVHPKTAAQYRQAFSPSGAKSDPGDTASLLDLLLRHREQLRMLQPDTTETRLLQELVKGRRDLVDDVTRLTNRLKANLKQYFPQVLNWFDEVDSPLVGALLKRWGSLTELKRAHPGTLKQFFHEHNCRSEKRIQERITGIQQAMPATTDPAILEGCMRRARSLVDELAALRNHIAEYDKRIAQVATEHADWALFASLPGAGKALAPRLIAAFGSRRERFDNAYEMQCLSGIAPVTERSGQSKWEHFRWACPKFLRQTFHEFATHSIRYSGWARAFYDAQIDGKKSHHVAVRALAFRWIRIIFRCWKDGRPYDEQLHLGSLHRKDSPLIGAFALDTDAQWLPVAGFQKLSARPS